eukprot:2634444-Heterocapsa_arctica.AAC.1
MMTGLFQVQNNSFKATMEVLETKVSVIDKKADESLLEIRELKGRMAIVESKQGDQGTSDMPTDEDRSSKKRVGWVRNVEEG